MTLGEVRKNLDQIFAADRVLRDAERKLLQSSDGVALVETLASAVASAQSLRDRDEAILRLRRLADLCAQLKGPQMADALVSILDDPDPSVRVVAGEALRDLGYERFAEIAQAFERAIERDIERIALAEIPWIVVEIGEPGAVKLIRPLLRHSDETIVASAIEALAELGDPAAVDDLRALEGDGREVALDEDDPDADASTIGELATQAIEELTGEDPS